MNTPIVLCVCVFVCNDDCNDEHNNTSVCLFQAEDLVILITKPGMTGVCVCVRARACVRARVVCVRVCVYVWKLKHVHFILRSELN